MRKKSPKKAHSKQARKLRVHKAPVGRPSIYSPELVAEFCRRIATGPRSTSSVCDDPDMPDESTVYAWLSDGNHMDFSENVARARAYRIEKVQDNMLALGTKVLPDDGPDPQRVNAAVNAFDKGVRLMTDKSPRRLEVSGPGGGALSFEHVDMTGWPADMIRKYRDSLSHTKNILAIADQSKGND